MINKVILVGNLGKDPEIKQINQKEIANFTIATTSGFGENKKTQWHNIVVYNEKIVPVVKNYIKKGSKVYVEGSLETREYTTKEGVKKQATNIVISYNSVLQLLDKIADSAEVNVVSQNEDDEVPF